MSLDRYRLQAQIGAGPDGVAYRASVDDGGTTVEVRDLSRARESAERWRALAPRLRLAEQLAHPAVIRMLELGLDGPTPYAALEWVGAETLAAAAGRTGPRTSGEAIVLIQALAGALEAGHRLGLAHGRLCPGQVLLADGARPKLDFTGAAVGFPAETAAAHTLDVVSRDAGPCGDLAAERAADLYSLGVLLAWLLTGRIDPSEHELHSAELGAGSPLGDLIRMLRLEDPAGRPTAREVQRRLAELAAPLDATGNWAPSGESPAAAAGGPGSSGAAEPRAAPRERGTPILEGGCPRLGRYRLLEKLGEGGQGMVFRAEDPAERSVVAIKVLRSDRAESPEVLRRFRKEARLMAEVNNPQVVNLLEYNEDDGIPYLVLEFVAGESLSEVLARRTRLEERAALAIMVEVARGLMQAHERGIVHRDIKPSNIMLLGPARAGSLPLPETVVSGLESRSQSTLQLSSGEETVDLPPREPASPSRPLREMGVTDRDSRSAPTLSSATRTQTLEVSASATAATVELEPAVPRIKISDFGLARHVVDSESLAMTAAGALLGTPAYMAPEQWTGRTIDPRTDVYAMGGTLFHLLAGRPPFEAKTRESLAAQHCNQPPPLLSTLNPVVSEGVARVVERALAKRPEDRYADAGAMLHDLEALLRGEPTGMLVHPLLPACDRSRMLEFEFRWELESPARELWPFVTNTDRLDRAIGFPALRYTTTFEPGRGVRTFAEGRKAGMAEVGEEHPYEWVEPRKMGVLREYSEGPFVWVVSVVELTPRPEGGTTLRHRLQFEPRFWWIRSGSRWGVGKGLRKRLESVYRRVDATLQARTGRGSSLEVDPFEETPQLSGPRRERLQQLLDRLAERGVDPAVVEQLGEHLARGAPQEIARIRPLALAERFQLDPDQVVAACLHGAREGLLELHWDLLCPVCRISCQVTDTLRAIADHAHCAACHLDFQLDFANSIELIFRAHPEVREVDLGTYCIGGPAHSPHVLAQVRVAPGERIELDLELPEGSYRLRGPQLPWSVDFQVRGSATLRRWELDLASGQAPERPAGLRPGGQAVVLYNAHDRELVVRIERAVSRSDALTASRVASLALFRELFPGELLAPGQLATVSTVTLLVTALDPVQTSALYERLGDAGAFGVIHEHFQRLSDAIRQGGGAVVKTQGEGVLASFGEVTAAVQTALVLPAQLARGEATRSLHLRVGIHHGAALAATLNDQLDYFGATVRDAVGTLQYARANELVLTQAVAADPEVAALLNERRIDTEVVPAERAGRSHVIRIRLDASQAGTHDAQGRKPS